LPCSRAASRTGGEWSAVVGYTVKAARVVNLYPFAILVANARQPECPNRTGRRTGQDHLPCSLLSHTVTVTASGIWQLPEIDDGNGPARAPVPRG
jgi:hypothetical protein